MKKCGCCKDYLEENLFSFHKGKLQSFCKQCQSDYAKGYRKKHKSKLRENLKEWRKTNKSDRTLSDSQKLAEEFRSKMRRFLSRKDDSSVDQIFGYSSNELKQYLISHFGKLPNKDYLLTYINPLKNFNLSDILEWKEAARFENLKIVKKNT